MKIADILDELELFQEFQYAELETIAAYLGLEQADKGQVIFSEGDPGNYMLILSAGRISILKGGEHGNHLLSHEVRGRIIGDMAMLDQELRSATCVADSDCEFLTLTSDNMKKLAVEHAAVAYHFMLCLARLLSRRLRRVSGMMADFLGN
ncbi:MAG TPA: cyclic nucleotide-binding protein [Janthinobacterium sp.]|nr:cyclic nucleotide-binding protein [Janthinobacterium sp.]